MSGKNTALGEYGGWLDDIGLSGPIQNNLDYDEIPGFVNASVFGRFSLDDLDFGDDLTKGRIDFDDEYLLKSPSPGSITLSESSIVKAETRDSDSGKAGAFLCGYAKEDARIHNKANADGRQDNPGACV